MLSLLSLVPLCRVYRKSHPKAVFSALSLFDIFNFYFAFALWSIFLPCRKLNEARSSQLSALSLRSYRCPTAVADGRNNRGTEGQRNKQQARRVWQTSFVFEPADPFVLLVQLDWSGVEWRRGSEQLGEPSWLLPQNDNGWQIAANWTVRLRVHGLPGSICSIWPQQLQFAP